MPSKEQKMPATAAPQGRSKSTKKTDAANKASDEQSKLEALLADPDPGAIAVVLRERARLELDNKHLKARNLRIWGVLFVFAVGFFGLAGAMAWWFPKYRYVATTDNRAVCPLSTQEDNIVTPATVSDFAKDSVINAYSYDYINYRDIINDVTNRWFNERGRKAFLKSLDSSGNLERVVKGRLIMRAFSTNAPQLETEGKEGTQRFWTVQVPIAIEFYLGGQPTPSNTQDFVADVRVMQEPASALNPKGIAVDSVVLRPSVRRK